MPMATRENSNYLGELFLVGAFKTPFLNMIGGIDGANLQVSAGFAFPVAQPYALGSASQPAITEADSASSNAATTISRSQDTNTVQIFQETVEATYSKLSTYGEIAGIANSEGVQPVRNELEFQKMAHLKQMALDIDYTFLNGAYQAATDSTTAAKSRGILTAITTNAIAAGGAVLSKALIDNMLRDMADNGAIFEQVVIFVNSFNKQKISDVYGYAPEGQGVGGVAVDRIITDFGPVGVVYSPNVPAASLLAAEMSVCKPVTCLIPGQAPVFYEDLAKVAASNKGQLYTQMGLNYGPEEYHGKITGLAITE